MFKKVLQHFRSTRSDQRRHRARRRRPLRLERLDKRELLAADLGAIAGTMYLDLTGDGLTPDDPRLGGVEIRLWRDGGDGAFDGGDGDDQLVATTVSADAESDTPGMYRFDGLSAGTYFVEQDVDSSPGFLVPEPVMVEVVDDEGVLVQVIDAFTPTAVDITADSDTPNPNDQSTAPEAIGGARKTELEFGGGAGDLRLRVIPDDTEFAITTIGEASGIATLRYDGDTDSPELVADGLGGIDLSEGDVGAGIVVRLRAALAGSFDVNLYSDADNFSTQQVTIPDEAIGQFHVFSIPLAGFEPGDTADGPADFTDIGAIEMVMPVQEAQNIRMTILESRRPDLLTADLQNFGITLGDQVFLDANNDGLFDSDTEDGIAGVTVQLFELGGIDEVVDPLSQTPIATTVSDGDGRYQFQALPSGFYAAVIPADQFQVGGALQGLVTSSADTPGAAAKIDNDDDGRDVEGQSFVITETFQMVAGEEPSGDGLVNNTVDFGFVPSADLAIDKQLVSLDAGPDDGRLVTFRIDVTNNGPQDATGLSVVDTLPAGLSFDAIASVDDPQSPPPGVVDTTLDGDSVTLDLIDLSSGQSTSLLLIAAVADGVFGTVENTATVSGDQIDVDPDNNEVTVPVLLPETDLRISKTVETPEGDPIPPASVQTGDTIIYRLTAFNDGPDDASGVTVLDTLPDDVSFVSATIGDGQPGEGITVDAESGELSADVGEIANDASVTVLITATVNADAAPLITNAAVISNSPNSDPDLSNNTSDVDTVVIRAVDLALDKQVAEGSTPALGGSVIFEVTVSNVVDSPGDARGFTVFDTLPDGLSYIPDSFDDLGSGVTIDVDDQLLTFSGVPLDVGQSVSFIFAAAIPQGDGDPITNTATVMPHDDGVDQDVDVNEDNDVGEVVFTPIREVDLVVTKDDGLEPDEAHTPGTPITYAVTVTNTGTSDAVNVNVVDTLPSGVIATSITLDGDQVTDNNPDEGTLSFVIPSVPTGVENAVTVMITANVGSSLTGSITNSVTISGGGVNDPPEGNSATVTSELEPAVDVAVTKDGPSAAVPGDAAIQYTLQLVNSGPSVATDVSVVDTLPAGVIFESLTLDDQPIDNAGSASSVEFVIPTLAVGQENARTAVITVTIDPAADGVIDNSVVVTAEGDTDTSNNTDSVSTTLTPVADIGVAISSSPAPPAGVAPGDTITYTIEVFNEGPSVAADVVLAHTLPAGVSFDGGSGPEGSEPTVDGQTVTFNIGTMAAPDGPDQPSMLEFIVSGTVDADASGTLESTANVTTSTSEGANTAPNQTSISLEIGTTISGVVFQDDNDNNALDEGEPLLEGVTVNLIDAASGETVATATTDSDGQYQFVAVVPGTYNIDVVPPAGLQGNSANPDSLLTDVDVQDEPISPAPVGLLTIPVGPGSVGGQVFIDRSGSGVPDQQSWPVGGLVVHLVNVDTDTVVDQTSTSANGSYAFQNVVAGQYRLLIRNTKIITGDLDNPDTTLEPMTISGTATEQHVPLQDNAGSLRDRLLSNLS